MWTGDGYKPRVRHWADHARQQGWEVGTVLYGHPIIRDGIQIERGRTLIITAIGQQMVLGIAQLDGEDRWRREGSWGFDSRKWEVADGPQS